MANKEGTWSKLKRKSHRSVDIRGSDSFSKPRGAPTHGLHVLIIHLSILYDSLGACDVTSGVG